MEIARIQLRIILPIVAVMFLFGCQAKNKQFYPYTLDNEAFDKVKINKKVLLIPTQLFTLEKSKYERLNNALDKAIASYLKPHSYDLILSDNVEKI